jgi:hypothetical protein
MATVAPRGLKIGTIFDKTLAVVERSARPALIYFVVLAACNGALGYLTANETAIMTQVASTLLKFAISVIAAYLLLGAMLRRTGLLTREDGEAFLAYVGLSVVYSLVVFLGFIAVILPGFYFMARWSVAQPMLIAGGGPAMQALGESWERTKPNEFQILGVVFLILFPAIVISAVATLLLGPASLVGIVVSTIASIAAGLLLLAMSVALYGLIVGGQANAVPSA